MNTKPALIDAIVGNSRMLVTLTGDGELQRIFWPHVDGGQHVQRLLGGVSVNAADVLWQTDPAWSHTQAYERDQNVLETCSRLGSGLAMRSTDAATPGRDLLVRRVTFTNRSDSPMALQYVLYQWLRVDENPLYNTALFDDPSDSLVHYRRDVFVAVGGDRAMATMHIGRPDAVLDGATRVDFPGGMILHGDVAAAGAWDLGTLPPGASVSLSLFWAFGTDMADVRRALARARQAGANQLLTEVRAYWAEWLGRARPLAVAPREGENAPLLRGIPVQRAAPEQIAEVYRRSLLVFKLLADEQTGAVIAAPEFDSDFTSCGGYAYCWGRDAAYITVAMDLAGCHELASAFYRWALRTQEPEGWWMHRHTASGQWGSSWGLLQVDETGSILYGMAVHARVHGGAEFAESVWPSAGRAADWLLRTRDPASGLSPAAVDLWEERTAQLTYSSAAVFAGLQAAADLADMVGHGADAARYRTGAEQLREAVLAGCVRDGTFLRGRNLQVSEDRYREAQAAGEAVHQGQGPKGHPIFMVADDPAPDASLLGLAVPFGLVTPDSPAMALTAERLVAELWTESAGGMRRYAGDHYRGGNPWVLCTLWLGLYAAERGDQELARQLLDWAVNRRTGTGLLPEQVDPVTGRPAWVVPLTWSHAMYVLLALRLYGHE